MPPTMENRDELRHHETESYERDLTRELCRRLEVQMDYDRYIANARGRPELVDFYQTVSSQEQANIARLKLLVKHYVSTEDAPDPKESTS